MLKKLITLAIIGICASLLGLTIANADVTYTNAAGVGSIGEAFSNGVVINSGVAPTTSGLCKVTGASGLTASYTTCPGSASSVSSLNSLTGSVTIAAGSNVTVTPSGNTLTIATSGGALPSNIVVSSVSASTSAVISSTSINASGVQVATGSVTIGGGGTGILGSTGMSGRNVIDVDTGNPTIVEQALRRSDSTPSQAASLFIGKQRGTLASPSAVISGDALSNVYGYGFDGTDYYLSSNILTTVSGTVASGVVPGKISFQTANASGVLTEAFNVTSAQIVNFQSAVAISGTLAASNLVPVVGTPAVGSFQYYSNATGNGTISIYAPTSSTGELELFSTSGTPSPMATTLCPAAAASTGLTFAGVATCTSSTLPVYLSGGCSTHGTVTGANGPFAFSMTTTGTCTGSQPIVWTMPSGIATTSWHCNARDVTQPTYIVLQASGVSATQVTVANYGATPTGVGVAWVTGDNIEVECKPY